MLFKVGNFSRPNPKKWVKYTNIATARKHMHISGMDKILLNLVYVYMHLSNIYRGLFTYLKFYSDFIMAKNTQNFNFLVIYSNKLLKYIQHFIRNIMLKAASPMSVSKVEGKLMSAMKEVNVQLMQHRRMFVAFNWNHYE